MTAPPTSSPRLTTADWTVVCVALVLPTAITWFYFVALAKSPALVQQTAYVVVKASQFALPIVWVWFVQRERPRWPPPSTRGLLLGAAFGLLVAAAMAALYLLVLKPRGLFTQPAIEVQEKIKSFGLN